MRRGPRPFALHLVLLALLAQLAFPAAAAAMSARMADPFAAMPICSPGRDADERKPDQQAPVRHDCQHCVVCYAAVATGLETAAGAVVPPPALVRAVRPRLSPQASPRGPPLLRPNARGPPITA